MGSLLMPFVLVFMLAGAGTVLIGYHAQRDKVEAERAELLEVYARSLVKPLWDCDTATLNGIAHALAHQNGVVNVQLFDVCSGQTISTAALSDHPDVTPPIRRPIFYDGVTDRSFLV